MAKDDKPANRKEDHRHRAADALRDNLRRRKQQQKKATGAGDSENTSQKPKKTEV